MFPECAVCNCPSRRDYLIGAGKKDWGVHYFCTEKHMIQWFAWRFLQDSQQKVVLLSLPSIDETQMKKKTKFPRCEVCKCPTRKEYFIGAGKNDWKIHYFCTAGHFIQWFACRFLQDSSIRQKIGISISKD